MIVAAHVLPPVRVPSAVLSPVRIKKIVKGVFRSEKRKPFDEVNVIFVDRKKIRRLNKQFLATTGDTDVIAFPYDDAGDIYICVPVANENARRFKEPRARELTRLVVHGTLHLLGYADEPERERRKMWNRQEPLVKRFWRMRP